MLPHISHHTRQSQSKELSPQIVHCAAVEKPCHGRGGHLTRQLGCFLLVHVILAVLQKGNCR